MRISDWSSDVCSSDLQLYAPQDPIDALGNAAKVEALRRVDKLLRAADPRVKQVMVGLTGGVDTILVARSDGVLAGAVRPQIGRAHVCTPVTTAHLVSRLLLETNKKSRT